MKNYDHADWEDDDVPNYDVDDDTAGPGRLRYAPGASILPSIVDAFAQCSYVLECYARQYNTYCTVYSARQCTRWRRCKTEVKQDPRSETEVSWM